MSQRSPEINAPPPSRRSAAGRRRRLPLTGSTDHGSDSSRHWSVTVLTPVLLLAGLVGLSAGALAAQAPVQEDPLAEPVEVAGVEVRGNERLAPEIVIGTSGLRGGQMIDYREVQRAIRRLWDTGQFEDVRLLIDPVDEADPAGPVTVILEIEELPVVSSIEFRGLERVSPGAIRDSAGLETGTTLRRSQIHDAEAAVGVLLADKGVQLRSVTHRLEPLTVEGEYALIFDVEEGQRIALAEVVFEGNEAFSDGQLRSVVGTKPEGFLWFRSGNYDEAQLRRDVREQLPDFYGENGYIDFVVTGDTMIVDPASGKARLVVEIAEGPQYKLAEVEVRGNRRFATEHLRSYFDREGTGLIAGILGRGSQEREGDVFDAPSFRRATDGVQQLYRNSGYLFARVEPVVERIEANGDDQPAVRAVWQVEEGEQAYFGKVSIRGNNYTHERVIRDRIQVLPGAVYSDDAIMQSYQNIMALGFFEQPMPEPGIDIDDEGDVEITFEVEEKQTASVNFGTSVGGGTGMAGFIGFDHPNLFGQAKSGHLRWEYGRWSNNLEARYADPALFDSRMSGSVSLFNTRDRFIQFQEGQRLRTGSSLRFGLPFPLEPRFSQFFVGYSISRTRYQEFDSAEPGSLFGLPPGIQSTVSLGLTRQTLNHPLFPTSGSSQEIEAAFSGKLLGGDADFQKYTASGSWWVPVGSLGGESPMMSTVNFTFGLTGEIGMLVGDRSSLDRFPFERFWMGGVQFGRPLRGYDETTITPDGYFDRDDGRIDLPDRLGDAYMRLSAEYAVRFGSTVSLALFYDAGNLWRGPSEINPTQLMRGAGLGVTLVTPFGPLGLDYAYGFDKTNPGWQLHFNFGGMR